MVLVTLTIRSSSLLVQMSEQQWGEGQLLSGTEEMLDELSCVVGLLPMVWCCAADHAATAAPSLVLALVRSGDQQPGGAQPPNNCSPTPSHFSAQ